MIEWRPLRAGFAMAVALSILGGLAIATLPEELAPWREPTFDRLVSLMPMPDDSNIMVVDIGARSDSGQPWRRGDTARLLTNIAGAQPSAMALDIVLGSDCAPGATNQSLADAIARVPTTLGFLLAPEDSAPPRPEVTLATSGDLALPLLWQASGAEHACPMFEDAALGASTAALAGGMDAIIRDVPALVVVGQNAYLGLAPDAVRLAAGRGSALLGGNPAWLRITGHPVEIGPAAQLRFRPSAPDHWAARTLDAAVVLAGADAAQSLAGKIVFVGSSDPGSGALRATAASPLHPSVQIHADVAAGLLGGVMPVRPVTAPVVEAAFGLAGGLLAGIAGSVLAPALAGVMVPALALLGLVASAVVVVSSGALFDPVAPGAVIGLAGMVAILMQAAQTRRAEAAMRRRMAQLLPADVVRRLVRQPNLLRLEGEERDVTALFTDIEGFTQSLRGVEPRAFVAILDAYFSGMTRIVLQHGGMIDKLVGDAVHALFNAPANLDHHVDKAIACAMEMHAFGEAFRQQPEMQALRFGRTRIGIETGRVILGDVGAADKIDYTAHGAAINMAARLEAANKELGSAICIGPAAAEAASVAMVSLGAIELRGFGMVSVFTPASMPTPNRN